VNVVILRENTNFIPKQYLPMYLSHFGLGDHLPNTLGTHDMCLALEIVYNHIMRGSYIFLRKEILEPSSSQHPRCPRNLRTTPHAHGLVMLCHVIFHGVFNHIVIHGGVCRILEETSTLEVESLGRLSIYLAHVDYLNRPRIVGGG
jgi:hypothetical protein